MEKSTDKKNNIRSTFSCFLVNYSQINNNNDNEKSIITYTTSIFIKKLLTRWLLSMTRAFCCEILSRKYVQTISETKVLIKSLNFMIKLFQNHFPFVDHRILKYFDPILQLWIRIRTFFIKTNRKKRNIFMQILSHLNPITWYP